MLIGIFHYFCERETLSMSWNLQQNNPELFTEIMKN